MELRLPHNRLERDLHEALKKLSCTEMAKLWEIQRTSKSYNPAIFSKKPDMRITLAATDLLLETPHWQPSLLLQNALHQLCKITKQTPDQPSLSVKLLLPQLTKKFFPWLSPRSILVVMQAPSGGKLLEEKEISCNGCGRARSSNNECSFCYKKDKIVKNLYNGINELSSQEITFMRRVTDSFLETTSTTNNDLTPSESLAICIYEKTSFVQQQPTPRLIKLINIFAAGVHLLGDSSSDSKELETFIQTSAEKTCDRSIQEVGKYWWK